jgi:squalene-hopene/tetraprenyl-beta-curcumene cyclase
MPHARVRVIAMSSCLLASIVAAHRPMTTAPQWNARAAATYLDGRMSWWLKWPTASRDHGTACVSCHTALPYALARPALRTALAEANVTDPERRLVENVVKRVWLWKEVDPFYSDQTVGLPKTSESRGTESILNALILARRDAERGALSDDARQAFGNMWSLQFRNGAQKGAWAWLNFHNEPWEANGSPYFGAALAAIAVGSAPGSYAASPDIQDRVIALRDYLQRGADTVQLFNRAMALWASGYLPGVVTAGQRQSIIDALYGLQGEDGGWSTSSLGPWAPHDGVLLDPKSDGFATALVLLALERAGVSRDDAHVHTGLDWLAQHQDKATGMWVATSLNKTRDLATDTGKFMSDAATAYAVLALTQTP